MLHKQQAADGHLSAGEVPGQRTTTTEGGGGKSLASGRHYCLMFSSSRRDWDGWWQGFTPVACLDHLGQN